MQNRSGRKESSVYERYQEIELENCANLSDVEANVSLIMVMSFVIRFSSKIVFAAVK